jgi:hypothetical protein
MAKELQRDRRGRVKSRIELTHVFVDSNANLLNIPFASRGARMEATY